MHEQIGRTVCDREERREEANDTKKHFGISIGIGIQ